MIEEVILFQIDKTSKIAKQYSQGEFDRLNLDITVEQWILLKIIHENVGMSQKDIAVKSLRDPASITRTLDILQKKKLLTRSPIPENRRQYKIDLTKKGKQFIDKHMSLIKTHRKRSVRKISKSDQKKLVELLQKIQHNMQ